MAAPEPPTPRPPTTVPVQIARRGTSLQVGVGHPDHSACWPTLGTWVAARGQVRDGRSHGGCRGPRVGCDCTIPTSLRFVIQCQRRVRATNRPDGTANAGDHGPLSSNAVPAQRPRPPPAVGSQADNAGSIRVTRSKRPDPDHGLQERRIGSRPRRREPGRRAHTGHSAPRRPTGVGAFSGVERDCRPLAGT